MISDVDVIVVGAGPAGLLLAGDLAQAGASCMVFERRTRRSTVTRAFTVYARTLEQLDARGAADELVAAGAPVAELRFFAGAAVDLSRVPSRFPYLLVAPQYETERVLEERATRVGADIRHGSEVTGLTQHPGGVVVKARQGGNPDRLVRAGWVVGADGMQSTVRRALGMPFPGKPVVRSVMLAEVRLTQPPPEVMTVNSTGDAFALIAPFGDGFYRVIAWHRRNQSPEDAPVGLDEVCEVTRQVFGTDYGIHDPRWMSRFHSEERQVPRYRDGRVLLAGDAAHVHSPAGGQGLNTGIQDAANLGWKLAATVHGWAPPGLLDTYHSERHPIGRHVLRGSGALLRLFTVPPALVTSRNVVASAATRIPFVASRLAAAISGVGISYPAPAGAHPLAGKRVADLPLADGRRLYEALRGGRFLLAARPGALPADGTSGYGDRVEAAPVARASGTVALIRPDAYIAWAAAGDAATASQIRDSLARWCGSPAHPAAQTAGQLTARRRESTALCATLTGSVSASRRIAWPGTRNLLGCPVDRGQCQQCAARPLSSEALPALTTRDRQVHRTCRVIVLQGQLSMGICPRACAGVRNVVGRYDLGGHAATALGATWLVRQRLSDEGKSVPLGPGFLDSSVSQRQPLPWPGI